MGEHCWHDECAIMAVSLPFETANAAQAVYDGLRLLQHRGQDGSGMAVWRGRSVRVRKKTGLVAEVYNAQWLQQPTSLAIGHNRYATQGDTSEINLQPHRARCSDGEIFLASNGDVTNFRKLQRRLHRQGVRFVSKNDGELLAWLIARAYDRLGNMHLAIRSLYDDVTGAYSAVMLFRGHLFVFRDPLGFRPLVRADLAGGGVAFASETVAFDILRADPGSYREVQAGAIIEVVQGETITFESGWNAAAPCVFELIYFARPDSLVFGLPVSFIRRRIGWQLARETRRSIGRSSVVIPVPDSANEIAAGVAQGIDRPLRQGLLRSHTARRTFIESEQSIRDEGVKYKLNPDRSVLEGMDVVLVDDSIVRGTTTRKIVRMLKSAGACTVHVVIGSPPMRWPCFMGVATPTRKELIASQVSLPEIRKRLGADSLNYLSLTGLQLAVGPLTAEERRRFGPIIRPYDEAPAQSFRGKVRERLRQSRPDQHCFACFTGNYPIDVPLKEIK